MANTRKKWTHVGTGDIGHIPGGKAIVKVGRPNIYIDREEGANFKLRRRGRTSRLIVGTSGTGGRSRPRIHPFNEHDFIRNIRAMIENSENVLQRFGLGPEAHRQFIEAGAHTTKFGGQSPVTHAGHPNPKTTLSLSSLVVGKLRIKTAKGG